MQQLPRDLWRFDVDIARVADLSSSESLARVGLPPPEPERTQWPTFQSVGETVAEAWAGVLYPAAARPSSLALCLFRTADRLVGVDPVPPPIRYEEPPVPPRGLRA